MITRFTQECAGHHRGYRSRLPPAVATLRIRLQICRIIPFSVLGFWDKNSGICAGACHIDLRTTRI